MANCCVIGCSNSYYQLQRWAKSMCSIHQQKRHDECFCKEPFQLFSFPNDKKHHDLRLAWIKNVNRRNKDNSSNWQPNSHSRICSTHFVNGTPSPTNSVPILNMGYDMKTPASRKPPQQRHPLPTTVTTPRLPPKSDKQHAEDVQHDHPYKFNYKCDCSDNCNCVGCVQKELKISFLNAKIALLEKEASVKLDDQNLFYKVFIDSDKNVKRFLGLPNKKLFWTLVRLVTPKAKYLRYWKGSQSLKVLSTKVSKCPANVSSPRKTVKPGPERKLTIVQELILVFLKLRHNITNEFLSVIFKVGPSLCSQVITTWLKFMAHQFRCLIYRPSKEEVKATLPECFQDTVPNARGIIDCSEFFIETPNSLDVQASTWSDYKHSNTLKCLIDITPTGIIQFISSAWGGRTSDKSVVLESGYLDTIERGDTLLADRGFPIGEDLLIRGAQLYIPPGARGGEQMTKDKVLKTKKVANLRIYVERAINRLKWFRILSQTLPISMAPLIDDILIVCAIIVNLYRPLVK